MSDLALTRALLGRRTVAPPVRMARVKITQSSPLLVQLPDGATVPALPVSGLTYTAGTFGTALLAEGLIPILLPTP